MKKELPEVQHDLDTAVADLQQLDSNANTGQFLGSLGTLVESLDRVGVDLTDEQKDGLLGSLALRGFKSADELPEDPAYKIARAIDPDTAAVYSLVGNVMLSMQNELPVPQAVAHHAFRLRDELDQRAGGQPS
ncbi:hypothetical protein CR970_00045 [Candidatus Saccharibacteria bacterium]|nr:MAG: hypothetical protein CR970_00045 [Candidatus Saccharibacteria bacterium]